jgi:flavodoxin
MSELLQALARSLLLPWGEIATVDAENRMKKVLVASYSLDGTTSHVARDIARMLSADVDEIRDVVKRAGMFRYIQAGIESIARGLPTIQFDSRLSDYDLVVLGTPVWTGTMASPMRSFLYKHASQLKEVACFCTMGGSGSVGTLNEMRAMCGTPEALTFAAKNADVTRGRHVEALEGFVEDLMQLASAPIAAAA